MNRQIGLVAGDGALPLEIARRLAQRGAPPVIYALSGNNAGIGEFASGFVRLKDPRLGELADDAAERNIGSILLAGRVPKSLMFRPDLMDDVLKNLIAELPVRDDHSLLGAIVAFLESRGIRVLSYKDIIPELMAPLGHIAGRTPSLEENGDILYGARIASAVVPLSFGQTVVVHGRSVVAVEAMEGTDAAIERAGKISGGGVVIKMMRPDQDERFDLPTVGTETLKSMHDAGLTCLAVESGRTIVLGSDLFKESARSWDIAVTGITPDLSS
ncbi:MAG: UDP-2,3-diacylglucosamine diphosphatase LpxI [Thermovirgaceae bacterium]|nr:UDP-2,3-diacylglucosamine diphosphatase LpxI [Thermovirgaceae bacterium]